MKRAETAVHTLAPGKPGGPLIVLAHGLEDRWNSWIPMVAALDPGWRMVALDLPWRSGNDYRWHHRSSAQWLDEALEQVGERPDVLIAHSYGANAALNLLCELDPRPVPALLLICPLYRQPQYPVTWRMFERARTAFAEHIAEGVRARLRDRLATMEPDVLQSMIELAQDRVGPAGFVTVFRSSSPAPTCRWTRWRCRPWCWPAGPTPPSRRRLPPRWRRRSPAAGCTSTRASTTSAISGRPPASLRTSPSSSPAPHSEP